MWDLWERGVLHLYASACIPLQERQISWWITALSNWSLSVLQHLWASEVVGIDCMSNCCLAHCLSTTSVVNSPCLLLCLPDSSVYLSVCLLLCLSPLLSVYLSVWCVCSSVYLPLCLFIQHACTTSELGVVDGSCLESKGSNYTDASAVFVLIAAIIVFFMVRVSRTSHAWCSRKWYDAAWCHMMLHDAWYHKIQCNVYDNATRHWVMLSDAAWCHMMLHDAWYHKIQCSVYDNATRHWVMLSDAAWHQERLHGATWHWCYMTRSNTLWCCMTLCDASCYRKLGLCW